MSRLDDLLRIGAATDWITPVTAALQTLAHGGGVTLSLPQPPGYSPREVEGFLQEKGVRTWGLQILADDTLLVTVPPGQAAVARYWLDRLPSGEKRAGGLLDWLTKWE